MSPQDVKDCSDAGSQIASRVLTDNLEELVACCIESAENSAAASIRILVPFICSSSKFDLVHLYRQGYSVIGCSSSIKDGKKSQSLAESLFHLANVDYNTLQLPIKGHPHYLVCYQTSDERLKLLVGEEEGVMTTDAIGGPVDCIWMNEDAAAASEAASNATSSDAQKASNAASNDAEKKEDDQVFKRRISLLKPNFGFLLESCKNLTYERLLQLCPEDFNVQAIGGTAVAAADNEGAGIGNAVYLINNKGHKKLLRWHNRWASSCIGWHKAEVNAHLEKHYASLTAGRRKTDLTFLFPLCGKTKDMLWAYQQGHKVVGVEAVNTAVNQFFQESGLAFEKRRLEGGLGWVYTSSSDKDKEDKESGSIKILVCDLFKVTPGLLGGLADCVFDRGSYVAIEKADRKAYIELMYSLCAPQARHLMVAHEYDESKRDGPPRHVDRKEIPAFYKEIGDKVGKSATVELVDEELLTEDLARLNLTEMTLTDYLITYS